MCEMAAKKSEIFSLPFHTYQVKKDLSFTTIMRTGKLPPHKTFGITHKAYGCDIIKIAILKVAISIRALERRGVV
jgi:hypothetical protein